MTAPAPLNHARYETLRPIGRGGAGDVFLVRDRETGERLALKRLRRADDQGLSRLKREFRSLADISHPNLIKLYELGHDESSAFFTMEYLEGQDLKEYLRYDGRGSAAVANDNARDPERVSRVLGVFRQLASGVCTLHSASVLHRDLKPSNVMVTEGRVVLLDFGIALQVGADAATVTQDKLISGTPAYMAPEQMRGEHVSQANDWYAFGVMLYEALSGRLPIGGKFAELLVRKQQEDPEPISEWVDALPPDVSALCMALLSRNPEKRPNGQEVLRVLDAHSQPRTLTVPETYSQQWSQQPSHARGGDELALFGREAELSQLWDAFRSVQAGGFALVQISGESGAGKSLLVQRFLDELEQHAFSVNTAGPFLLRSRCYERETLPFKALDGAIDALVSYLSRESDLVVAHVLPRDLAALTQLFPVLRGLEAAQRLLERGQTQIGTAQVRAHAEAALRELLLRLGRERTVVLWIDDVQWGDLDSAGIVSSWLAAPQLPNVLLLLSYRSEEVTTSPCLELLLRQAAQGPSAGAYIALQPMRDEHVRALCQRRLESSQLAAATRAGLIERIVREAQGSPFLAAQLAHLVATDPSWGVSQLADVGLEQLVRIRRSSLSDGARSLLDVLSVAGRPISLSLALQAAELTKNARALVHELHVQSLIRTRELAHERLLETYHDRLAATVRAALSGEERRVLNERLFAALRGASTLDADWLHSLALAAGAREHALHYGLLAAERATRVLAFERAVELHEQCVALSGAAVAERAQLWKQLALAYARAGRGRKAAETYLQAAQHVDAQQALSFERAAASHLLRSGRFEEGEALLRNVLAKLDLDPPDSDAGMYAALGWEHTRLALRGLRYTPRARSEIPFEKYFGAEFCGMLSMETASYDPLRAALYQARCLRMALELGDEEGIGRALCAAATMECVSASERGARRADRLLARAETIAVTLGSAQLHVDLASARAICAYLLGRFEAALSLCYEADRLLRGSPLENEYHHRFVIASARIGTLAHVGDFERAESELQEYLQEAKATDNLSAELHISLVQTHIDEQFDRGAQARERLMRTQALLPQRGFGLLHVLHMVSVMRVGSVTGDYEWALSLTRSQWQSFERSIVRRSAFFSMWAYEAHARLLLNRCARTGTQDEAPRLVASHIKVLEHSLLKDSRAESARIAARVAIAQGDSETARRLLDESAELFLACGAPDHAARDRCASGHLVGGESGVALQRAALAQLRDVGLAAPERDLQAYYPELFGHPAA